MTTAASPCPGRVFSLFRSCFLSRWGGFRLAHVVVLACVFFVMFCSLRWACRGCALVQWRVHNVEVLPLGAVSFCFLYDVLERQGCLEQVLCCVCIGGQNTA